MAIDESAPREQQLRELDRRFRKPLISYFRRRLSSPAEAEDLTQDVFERILKSLSAAPIHNAEALVFRIALSLLRDRSRRQGTHGRQESLTPENIVEFADSLRMMP